MGVYHLSFLFLSYFAMDFINFHIIISAFSYEKYIQFSENDLSIVSFVPRVTVVRQQPTQEGLSGESSM